MGKTFLYSLLLNLSCALLSYDIAAKYSRRGTPLKEVRLIFGNCFALTPGARKDLKLY